MRIKFLPPHSKQTYTLNYLFQKEKENENCNLIYSNDNNNDHKLWIDQTEKNCETRKEKTGFDLDWNKNTIHLVLSIHPDDSKNMENNWMNVLHETHQYLSVDPYDNNSIAWLHKDKDHHHIHFVFSKIDNSGNRWDDSNIGRKLNDLAKTFDLKYNLTKPLEYDDTYVDKNQIIKSTVNQNLKELYSSSIDVNDFMKYSEKHNIGIILVETKNGTHFLFKDLSSGMEFSQNNFSRRYHYEALTKLDRNNPIKKLVSYQDQISFTKNRLNAALSKSKNIKDLKEELLKHNIVLKIHENSSGTFGYSFKQSGIANPIDIKASQVGLSFKRINYLIDKNSFTKDVSSFINQESTEKEYQDEKRSSLPGIQQTETDEFEQSQGKKRKKRNRNI